jgi:hypothetical protein
VVSELVWLTPFAKYAHIVAMFAAVTIQVGSDLYFLRVARDGDPNATSRLGHAIRRRGAIEGPILEIGIVFGLLTGFLGGFNFLAPWLIATYLLIAIGLVNVFRIAAPAFTSILDAADAGDSAGIARLLGTGRYPRAALANALMYASVIFLMVLKPFG